jgi:hypothetical protein
MLYYLNNNTDNYEHQNTEGNDYEKNNGTKLRVRKEKTHSIICIYKDVYSPAYFHDDDKK